LNSNYGTNEISLTPQNRLVGSGATTGRESASINVENYQKSAPQVILSAGETFGLVTARWARSHMRTPIRLPGAWQSDQFCPKNRLAFAFQIEWTANRNRTD